MILCLMEMLGKTDVKGLAGTDLSTEQQVHKFAQSARPRSTPASQENPKA